MEWCWSRRATTRTMRATQSERPGTTATMTRIWTVGSESASAHSRRLIRLRWIASLPLAISPISPPATRSKLPASRASGGRHYPLSLVAVERRGQAARFEPLDLDPYLAGAFGLGDGPPLVEVGFAAVAKAHRASVVREVELDLELPMVPLGLGLVAVLVDHGPAKRAAHAPLTSVGWRDDRCHEGCARAVRRGLVRTGR